MQFLKQASNLKIKMSRTIMCSKDNLEKNLSDKIYIVTGTTSGIGLETVTQLSKAVYNSNICSSQYRSFKNYNHKP